MRRLPFFILVSFFVANISWARLSEKTFNASETMTGGKLFLSQADVVCLYLSTDRIVYVPKLTADRQLKITLTFLDASVKAKPEALRNLVERHIHAFNKTMKDRLEFYAPKLAKEFNPNRDVDFSVEVGSQREKMALWQGGVWGWEDVQAEVPKEQKSEPEQDPLIPRSLQKHMPL